MKHIILSLLAVCFLFTAQAQTAFESYRYSNFQLGGTARTVGVGGAIGALGADFSVLSTNPAGLAAFRRSEFTITPSLFISSADALLNSNVDGLDNFSTMEDRAAFNLNNVGLVFTSRPFASKWKTINFGVGLNRLASFHRDMRYEGTAITSITDRYVELANGFVPEELDAFEEGLAYDVEAIFRPDPDADPFGYTNDFLTQERVYRQQEIRTKGSINELVFSFAGNYEEKLMIGATVGVPFVNYEEERFYQEADINNTNPIFNQLNRSDLLISSATGINLKLGMILRPIQAVRIGAALHTPTFFSFEDTYESAMSYDFDLDGVNYDNSFESPTGFFEYRLRTPWRVLGSLGVLIRKNGFLSAEVEYVDYGASDYRFKNVINQADRDFEDELNRQIENDFEETLRFRFGGEMVVDIFRFRGGYNLLFSPFTNENFVDNALSLGFGIRERGFFLDVAYRQMLFSEQFSPYTLSNTLEPVVDLDLANRSILVTLGFKL